MGKIAIKIKQALLISIAFMVICGFIYPLLLTGIGQLFFSEKANGSLVTYEDKVVGSSLVGQDFTEDYYLQGRTSAINYNTSTDKSETKVLSGSANLAVNNPELIERTKQDMTDFLLNNNSITQEELPTDLFTSSGSGVDPHISVQAASIQMPRISQNSGISESQLEKLISESTTKKLLGFMGEEVVNVLEVNIKIKEMMQEAI